MRILAIISAEYGRRHLENLQAHAPASWTIQSWQAPLILPPVIDYPEDYLPESLPPTDLLLSFAEHRGVAELLPDIARLSSAQAVIAAIDNDAWLPTGLARQLGGWLAEMGVAFAAPKPLCSLTETSYGVTRSQRHPVSHPLIAEFARHFGQPEIQLEIDPQTRQVSAAQVTRDAVCGCARYVASRLPGLLADDAEEKAGLLHHHFPCLASMVKLNDFNHDTLMHESGRLLKENLNPQLKPHQRPGYITPGDLSE